LMFNLVMHLLMFLVQYQALRVRMHLHSKLIFDLIRR
jgi:hypothetical protein